ncbi:MAG: hypothetical protein ACRD50_00135 [Candidatus Acidiferrales bacterium]
MAEKEPSGNRAIVLAILAVVIAVLAMKFGFQTIQVVDARYLWLSKHPELRQVPIPLPAPAAQPSSNPGVPLSEFQFKFDSPWGAAKDIHEGPGYASFEFSSGQRIIFYDPATLLDALHAMRTESQSEYLQASQVFGASLFASNFDMYQAVFSASPEQFTSFMPAQDAERLRTLLDWKMRLATNGETGIESFEARNLRGFLLGDPSSARYVLVKAFDTQDRTYQFIFTARPDAAARPTTAEIVGILSTFRPAWLP